MLLGIAAVILLLRLRCAVLLTIVGIQLRAMVVILRLLSRTVRLALMHTAALIEKLLSGELCLLSIAAGEYILQVGIGLGGIDLHKRRDLILRCCGGCDRTGNVRTAVRRNLSLFEIQPFFLEDLRAYQAADARPKHKRKRPE